MFVFESVDKNVISTETSGAFTTDQFKKILAICKESSLHIFQFYRDVVRKYAGNLSPS